MKSLNDVIIKRPTFEKVAAKDIPKNAMEWNESILQQFYEDVPFVTPQQMVDAVITDGDDKTGYAKGSVVVTEGQKKVNFPIIMKDWKLSPLDVFVAHDGEGDKYIPATPENFQKALTGETFGEPSNLPGIYGSTEEVKRPGGITPKESVIASTSQNVAIGDPTVKLAFDWHSTIHMDDLVKMAEKIEQNPEIKEAFIENGTGIVTQIIDEAQGKRVVPKDQMEFAIDEGNIISRKQRDTVTDNKLFDTSMLKPVSAPSHVQVRSHKHPTMESVIQSGTSVLSRQVAVANGSPVNGTVMNVKCKKEEAPKNLFISDDGKSFAIKILFNSDNAFKGVNLPLSDQAFDLNMRNLSNVTSDEMTFHGSRDTHADINFPVMEGGHSHICEKLAIVYGQGKEWEAMIHNDTFSKRIINGREAYVGNKCAIVKSAVAQPVLVEDSKDPIYAMAIGDKKMWLIPETSILINLSIIKDISDNLMSPDKSVSKILDEGGVKKVDVSVGDKGIKIEGDAVKPIRKLANLPHWHQYSTKEASSALYTMGMSKVAADEALTSLVKMASDGYGNKISVYGVDSDYIDVTPYVNMKKYAKLKPMLKEYIDTIKVDLIKEASVIDDPEVVDNMLSTNFINEDNLKGYIENISKLEEVNAKLAELLIASRMGLKDIEEGAIKKAMEGLDKVIKGLNKVKMISSSGSIDS